MSVDIPIIEVSEKAIDLDALMAALRTDRDGALSVFLGIVRNHADGRNVQGLEYSAYTAMAERKIAEIVQRAVQEFHVPRLAVVHRIGRLEIGTAVVAVVAASEHRAAGLDAVRMIIDAVKEEVPIWKKEFYVDEAHRWVDTDRQDWEVSDTTNKSEHA